MTDPTELEHSPRSAWMFEDWPEKSLAHAGQQLGMAVLRFRVSVIDKTFRPVARWLSARLGGE